MRSPLTVVNVAFPFAPVGPDAVGGAEQVVAMLDEALVAAGHRSIVVACEGSVCAGTLAPVPAPTGTIDDVLRMRTYDRLARAVSDLLREVRVDVVHMHGVDFHAYLPAQGPPVLVTLHLPLSFYPPHALTPARPRTWLHGVSASQMANAPAAMPRLPEVANGVRLDRLMPIPGPRRRYAIALGRICPEKGFHLALDAAERARVPMLLAGRVYGYTAHESYFREAIAPRLRDSRRFVGPVGPSRKRALLARARCLLVSSTVDETSSLVAMEALACGTPVVAFRAGALAEVVDAGRTGLLVDGVEEMARAIRTSEGISARACREAAERRFCARAMVRRYLEMYERVGNATDAREARC